MDNVFIAGAGTGVGKTVAAAVLTTRLEGDYWKPIQCGEGKKSDTEQMRSWIDTRKHTIHQPAYSLQACLSPHHAARLEECTIDSKSIQLPATDRPLIIEGVGGLFVPLTLSFLTFDLFKQWKGRWIVVSRHYLGSINHTLLTIEALKLHGQEILGLIFNGDPNQDSEDAILSISKIPMIGRLFPEPIIDSATIQRYAKEWIL